MIKTHCDLCKLEVTGPYNDFEIALPFTGLNVIVTAHVAASYPNGDCHFHVECLVKEIHKKVVGS